MMPNVTFSKMGSLNGKIYATQSIENLSAQIMDQVGFFFPNGHFIVSTAPL